jgi:hypothetical protein
MQEFDRRLFGKIAACLFASLMQSTQQSCYSTVTLFARFRG